MTNSPTHSLTSQSAFWRMVDRIDRIVGIVGWVGLAISSLFVVLVFLLLIAGALMRPWSSFIFGFAYEASSIMLWPISFLALATVWRNQGHVRFDLFLRLTRRRKHYVLELISSIVVFIIAALFVWQSWAALVSHYNTGTSTQTFRYAVWPMFSTVLIGSIILLAELTMSALKALREVIEPTGAEEASYSAFTSSDQGH